MEAVTFMASQGLLDDKTVLQLSVANSKIVTRLARHEAMKHEMEAIWVKMDDQRDKSDVQAVIIEDLTQAICQAGSAVALCETKNEAVEAAVWLMEFAKAADKPHPTLQDMMDFKAAYIAEREWERTDPRGGADRMCAQM